MVQSTRESAPYSSTSGFVDALNDSHQEPAEAAKVGKHKGLQPVDLNSSNRFDRLEELFLAEATAKALKASIEQLLGPLHRVRTGEGTKAETEAWKEYETR